MSYNKTLQQIPIVVQTVAAAPKAKPGQALHWARRSFQWGMLALAILIPITGLFRIDPIAGAFVVLDRQIWFSDFFIVIGFWVALATALVMLYSVAGTVFCGWACPQNTFSEWANMLTHKLLGKRAQVSLDGQPMQVSAAKNTWSNWLILGVSFTAVSMALGLIPLLYFYPPEVVWSFVTFSQNEHLAASLHYIYLIFVIIILLDIAFIRHFMCRFMCIYKVWQHMFKTKQTLHVAYDASRSDQCTKCNYCATSCFIDIDPRKTDVYDTCINCGECITACNNLQAKKNNAPGLLTFAVGERDRSNIAASRTGLAGLTGRAGWAAPFMVLGVAMFSWGLSTFAPYHVAAGAAPINADPERKDYHISIAHKLYQPGTVHVRVDGLPAERIRLSSAEVVFTGAERQTVTMTVDSRGLTTTLTPLRISLSAPDWQTQINIPHVVVKQPL